jgi:RNA polymerase sigma-70 factor (ECF subfamily)
MAIDPEAQPSEALLERALGGDSDALGRLIERHVPGLRAYIRLRMGPALRAAESSCDLTQSVCREVLVSAGRFRYGGEAGFRQWLYRIAQNKIADRVDYHGAARRAGNTVPLDEVEQSLALSYGSICTPSRDASAREQLARVEAAFDKLSDDHREVILGARLLGLSHRQLAERLNRSETAVRMLLFRAVARLAEILGET